MKLLNLVAFFIYTINHPCSGEIMSDTNSVGWNSRQWTSRRSKLRETGLYDKSITMMSAPAVIGQPTRSVAVTEASKKTNPIAQLGNYVKDSVVRLKDGTMLLYSNHKVCNTIRSKQKEYILNNPKPVDASYQKKGLTYDEYNFLNRGKDDRGKVMNLVFMMFFSPNFLPYAFMFFPNVLPSPFQQSPPIDFDKWETISRERAHTVMTTLLDIEQEAKGVPTKNPLNPFGGGKARKNKERMGIVYQMAGQMLLVGGKKGRNQMVKDVAGSSDNEEYVLKVLKSEIFSDTELERDQTRLKFVPKAIMKGLALAIDGNTVSPKGTSGANRGALSGLMPNFLTRNKVISHLKTINDADTFLVNEDVNVESLSGETLLDACHARMIGTPKSTEWELRKGLSKWLDLTVKRPDALISPILSPSIAMDDSPSDDVSNVSSNALVNEFPTKSSSLLVSETNLNQSDISNPQYYNANLAKFALLCYNAVEGARDSRSASALPRFLFH